MPATATDPHYAAALDDLTREFTAVFGESPRPSWGQDDVRRVADTWFRPDGSPKTRAMTHQMIRETMKEYGLPLREAATLFEKALLLHKNEHVIGGPEAYWEVVGRMERQDAEQFSAVHDFAWDDWKPQGDFMVSPSGKRKLRRESWERLKSRGKKGTPPKPADAAKPAESPKPPPAAEAPKPPPPESSHPAPPAGPPPAPPGATATARTGTTPRGTRVTLKPLRQFRPMAPGDPAVESATKLPPAPPPPPATTPAEKAHFEAAKKADEVKYGPRAAGVLSRAAEAVRGFLTLGGLTGGAYLGGKIGALAGGPLGLALGTAIGGGVGALAGRAWAGIARNARVRVRARQAMRSVVPGITGVAVGLPAAAIQTGIGGMLGAPLDTPGAVARDMAKTVRRAMATSAVSRRKAEQNRLFAELFADDGLPPNATAILKARLRVAAKKAGVTLPPIPDEVVAAALKLANQDAAAGTAAEALAEVGKFKLGPGDSTEKANRAAYKKQKASGAKLAGYMKDVDYTQPVTPPKPKVAKFRAKPFKMPITPMPVFRPKGGIGMFAELKAAVESARV